LAVRSRWRRFLTEEYSPQQKRNLGTIISPIPFFLDALAEFAKEKGLGNGSFAELTRKPEVKEEVTRLVQQTNNELASFESIKKFKILEHDFSIESGELTPKMSVKRKVVYDRHKAIFDAFYDDEF